jgi:hypothetical protein
VTHGSGTGGCEILKQRHVRDVNFSRGKSRISITFRSMKGIISILIYTRIKEYNSHANAYLN